MRWDEILLISSHLIQKNSLIHLISSKKIFSSNSSHLIQKNLLIQLISSHPKKSSHPNHLIQIISSQLIQKNLLIQLISSHPKNLLIQLISSRPKNLLIQLISSHFYGPTHLISSLLSNPSNLIFIVFCFGSESERDAKKRNVHVVVPSEILNFRNTFSHIWKCAKWVDALYLFRKLSQNLSLA